MKLIRALCAHAGYEFQSVTIGDPRFEYQGHKTIGWHFITDKGHFYMADIDGKALMFNGDSDELVCEIEVPNELKEE